MRMFSNYQNLADNYKPNNLTYMFPSTMNCSKLNPLDGSKPYEEYDAKGELVGYFWHYGDTLNLDFTIDGEITVEDNALILYAHGQVPSETTEGVIGQRCYNVVDFKSWTCEGLDGTSFCWLLDDDFIYPETANRNVYMSAEEYLKDKKIDVVIYNFRMEPICTRTFDGSSHILFEIDAELSKCMLRGIYYCSVTAYNSNVRQTIFDVKDCKLLVK